MNTLERLRKEIDEIDGEILKLLGRRLNVAREIGAFKVKNGLPVRDPEREQDILMQKTRLGKRHGVGAMLIKKVWRLLFSASYEVEKP